MFTRNYYTELLSQAASLDSTSQARASRLVDATGNTAMKGTSNNQHVVISTQFYSYINSANTSYSSYECGTTSSYPRGVSFGNGTGQPTLSDYCLFGDIVTGFTYNSSKSYHFDGNDLLIEAHFTITNNNSEEITISEIGLFDYKSVYYSKWYYYPCMIDHTLLETPITIPAGGVGQVTYTIRMNYPAG